MKTNITIIVALLLFGACTSYEERRAVSPMSIQLTASVAAETLSPGDATAWSREAWKELTSRRATRGLYETAIANGEKVYVWADKGSAGTYAFLKAWTLTSDGSGGLTGSTKYYPSDGDGLTFRAVHGNFSTAPTEGTAIGTLTHTVLADQSATGNYEKSDLHYGEGSGSYETVGSAPLNFTHKLSKIEVNLTAGIGLIPSNVTNVTVKVRNVKPSITINPSTGALGSASGTATTITARHTGNGVFEAVIPPQAAPSGVLTITMGNVTVTVPNTVATFAENAKYIYNVKCDNKDKRLNPLWYVAENNVKSYNTSTKVVTLETNPAAAGSAQCYNWYDAMGYFSKTGSSYDTYWAGDITDGTTGFKYHLPCMKEWISVVGSYVNMFDSSFLPSGGLISSAQTCIFGYNDATKAGIADWSYWSPYSEAVSGHYIRYALRYLGTPYCSVWKYDVNTNDHTVIITSKLIDYLEKNDASLNNKLTSYMNDASFWTSLNEDEGALKRIIYFVGYRWNGGGPGTGTADVYLGTDGYYWSTTETSEEDACRLLTSENNNGILRVDKPWHKVSGFSVRLFRNEGVGENRISKLSYATTSITHMLRAGSFTNPLSNNDNGTVTYSSSNTSVATVNSTTGVVTPVAVGTTTITATTTNSNYTTKSVSYTLAIGPRTADLGKVVATNGHVYATVSEATAAGTTASGIIAYVGSNVDASSTAYKCLVIALTDVSGTKAWFTSNSGTCVSQTSAAATAITYKNGISATNTLTNGHSSHSHAAATAAKNFSTARPTGASIWFLASIGQWNLIVQGLATKKAGSTISTNLTMNVNNTYKFSNLNSVVTDAGGTGFVSGFYSSSTEYTTTHIWRMGMEGGSIYSNDKNYAICVRPVFAM